MEEDLVKIYKLYDPRQPDIIRYVGKTINSNINNRLSQHIYTSKKESRYVCKWIQKLIKEGIKPKISKLDECFEQDWEFWEKFYIMKYKSNKLTNIELGGYSSTIRIYSKVGTIKNTKAIDQLSLDYKVINTFKSVAEAARILKVNKHVLAATCRGKQSKAYGYRWKFNSDKEVRLKDDPKKKSVLKMTINNKVIKEYSSIKEAADTENINYSTLSSYLRGINKQNKQEYVWEFKKN